MEEHKCPCDTVIALSERVLALENDRITIATQNTKVEKDIEAISEKLDGIISDVRFLKNKPTKTLSTISTAVISSAVAIIVTAMVFWLQHGGM